MMDRYIAKLAYLQNLIVLRVFKVFFPRSAAELSVILGHDSASQCNFFLETSTFENENTTPYGNVENLLRNDAARYPQRR